MIRFRLHSVTRPRIVDWRLVRSSESGVRCPYVLSTSVAFSCPGIGEAVYDLAQLAVPERSQRRLLRAGGYPLLDRLVGPL
jgi:hypothetical protein